MQDWIATIALLLMVGLLLLLSGPAQRRPGDKEKKNLQGQLNDILRRRFSDKERE